jgi:hypothetical protein
MTRLVHNALPVRAERAWRWRIQRLRPDQLASAFLAVSQLRGPPEPDPNIIMQAAIAGYPRIQRPGVPGEWIAGGRAAWIAYASHPRSGNEFNAVTDALYAIKTKPPKEDRHG